MARDLGVSEQVLWQHLRARRRKFKFRRQHRIGRYTLDFYCPDALLCIEVDGSHHLATMARDASRDQALAEQNIMTIRIPSADLFEAIPLSNWLEKIDQLCWLRSRRGAE